MIRNINKLVEKTNKQVDKKSSTVFGDNLQNIKQVNLPKYMIAKEKYKKAGGKSLNILSSKNHLEIDRATKKLIQNK